MFLALQSGPTKANAKACLYNCHHQPPSSTHHHQHDHCHHQEHHHYNNIEKDHHHDKCFNQIEIQSGPS